MCFLRYLRLYFTTIQCFLLNLILRILSFLSILVEHTSNLLINEVILSTLKNKKKYSLIFFLNSYLQEHI